MIKSDIDIRMALLTLEDAFAKSWDSGDAERHASLYTDNAVLEMEAAGPLPARKIIGRQTLSEFCHTNSRKHPGLHLIDVSSFNLKRRGNTATGSVKFEFCFFGDEPVADLSAFLPPGLELSANEDESAESEHNQRLVTGIYHTTYIYSRKQWQRKHRSMSNTEHSEHAVYNIPSLA